MELKRVVVTGMGAITPFGNTVDEYWNGLINGVSGADMITHLMLHKFKYKICLRGKRILILLSFLIKKKQEKLTGLPNLPWLQATRL